MKHKAKENISLQVLCLEDSTKDAEIISGLLVDTGYDLKMDCAGSEKEFVSFLRSRKYDVILSDFKLPGFDAFGALRWSLEICPEVPFICVSGSIGEETAIELLKQGAIDYVLKDRLVRLPSAIKRALNEAREKEAHTRAEAALLKSEEKYRGIFENVQDVYYEATMDGITLEVSPSIEIISKGQYRRDDLIGRSIYDFYSDPGVRQTLLAKLEERGNIADFEVMLKNGDGSSVPCSISAKIRSDTQGRPVEIVGTMRDITQRKWAENRLKESENRMRMIVEGTPYLFFYTQDTDAKITYVSPSVKNITGHSIDEWYNQTHWFVTNNKINILAKERTRAHLRGEFSMGSIFVEIEHADKYPILLEVYENPIIADGEVVGVQGIAHDITKRTLAENELRKLSRAVEQSPASIIITDKEGNIEYVNPKFTQVTGYTSAEALGQNPRMLKSGEKPTEEYKQLWETVTCGKEWRGELHNKKKNGELYWESALISPIKDASDEITHYLAVKEDITEKKLFETQLMRAQRMESIGTLAGGVAHDLNNVLAPIMLAIDVLRKSMPDERSQKMLESLESSAHRGSTIVKQILGFARGIQGETVPIQIRYIINEITNIIRETFPKSITIKESIPKNVWTIIGDATNLHQLILNLSLNARDAMPEGGTIYIKAENKTIDEHYSRMNLESKPGRFVMLSVEDNGCGIPPAVVEHIFEPFFTTKEVGKGTGLGLSTVHSIVKSHGGFLNVYSEIGKGTTFRIYLPAAEAADGVQPELEKLREMFMGHGELIMVVDDESSIRQITKHALETYGYRTITAPDGTEAIVHFASRKDEIDLVLVDMVMPIMDGPHTIKVLRKINPLIKIIASSGLTGEGNVAKDKKLGVNAFIMKPYNAEKLLEVVHSVLHKK